MSANSALRDELAGLTADQPPQPERSEQLLRRHQRSRQRRGAGALLVVAGAMGGVAATGALPDRGGKDIETVAGAASPITFDARYLPWQTIQPGVSPAEVRAALTSAYGAWSEGRTPGPDVKTIAVSGQALAPGAIVFEASDPTGALRLVSAAYDTSGRAVVMQDVPAPPPASVRALAILTQSDGSIVYNDGGGSVIKSLTTEEDRATSGRGDATAVAVFVPPSTSRPTALIGAPGGTVGEGSPFGTESFRAGYLGFGLGDAGRGAVPADGARVTVWDGDVVLFDGPPRLPS